MKRLLLIFTILLSHNSIAQKEGYLWYFGDMAALDFNTGIPIPIINSVMWAFEGCSSIADSSGNLLFYTNGVTIWNKNHVIMQNGNGLFGALSSTQSAIIVKEPSSNSIYYVFTTAYQSGSNGLRYSQVDMSLAGGLGAVTAMKNISLATPVAEKVTAVMHDNSNDIWIITHLMNSDAFYSYLVTSSGVNPTPVISNVGNFVINNISGSGAMGQLQASPQDDKLAIVNRGDSNQVLDFNNVTGVVSNPVTFYYSASLSDYGCEFSPSGNMLYFTTVENGGYYRQLLQFDLTAANIAASKKIISSRYLGVGLGQLELGPDGKIYVARSNKDFIGVINNPDRLGSLCNFIDKGVYLGGALSETGLPQSIHSSFKISSFTFNNICFGDSMSFTILDTSNIDSVLWNFGDINSGSNNFSNLFRPKHLFSDTGIFVTTLVEYSGTSIDTSVNSFYITPLPKSTLGGDTSICVGDTLVLGNFNQEASHLWQDSSFNHIYAVTQSGVYWLEITINSCSTIDTINVSVNICTLIDETENDLGILIYPNPNTGLFTIEKPSELDKEVNISLLDATSRVIINKVIPKGQQKIEVDITSYSKGIYYLQMTIGDKVYVKQILKN